MLEEEMASFANPDVNLVQRQCLEALRHACSWESGAATVEAHRGALATCRAMSRHWQDALIQERGCGIFQGLAQGARKGWSSLLAAGGLKQVCQAMRQFRTVRSLQMAAFEALLALPSEAAKEVEAAGCHQELLASMSAYGSDLQLLVKGCGAVRLLASGSVALQEARQPLMRYIQEFPDEVPLLVASSNALAEISMHEGLHVLDRSFVQGISNFLVAHKKDAQAQAAGMNGFRAMATVGASSLEAALEARCIERARMALLDHKDHEEVQSRGLDLLQRVAAYNTNMRDLIIEAGLYPIVFDAQETCKASAEVCRQSIRAAGTLLGFVTAKPSQQEERKMQSAKSKTAQAASQQRSGALAFGKLIKETDLVEFAIRVEKLMQHHKHSSLFLQDACLVLRSLAESSDDGLKAVQSAGVLQTLMASLQKHKRSEAVNFHGFRVLWGLLSSSTSRREALEAGVVEWSTAALARFMDCPAVQSALLLVVNRLCLKNPDVKVAYVKAKILPLIWQILETENLFLRGRSLAVLATLASNCFSVTEEMMQMGALELAVDMLQSHTENAQIQGRSIQMLWGFMQVSRDPQVEEIYTEEMLDVVLTSIQSHATKEQLQSFALGFLWTFTSSSLRKRWLLARKGVATVCTSLEAFPHSSMVQRHGLEVLRSMSTSDGRKWVLSDGPSVEAVTGALKLLRHDAEVMAAALGLLGNLACGNVEFKRRVFKEGLCNQVLVVMEEHARDVAVQVLGTWALGVFVGLSQKRARELFELGGKDRVFAAMAEHALNDSIRAYGPLLVRRLELVQEMTVNAANMEDQELEAEELDVAPSHSQPSGSVTHRSNSEGG
ncbi:Protein aardvark [Durusdinium trenchii]|uniref:Protein aardvark n=1 Tax=Durusdinium trenchii TaxID=1381693 RepID=A0ABP0I6J7_9DINO